VRVQTWDWQRARHRVSVDRSHVRNRRASQHCQDNQTHLGGAQPHLLRICLHVHVNKDSIDERGTKQARWSLMLSPIRSQVRQHGSSTYADDKNQTPFTRRSNRFLSGSLDLMEAQSSQMKHLTAGHFAHPRRRRAKSTASRQGHGPLTTVGEPDRETEIQRDTEGTATAAAKQ
jgi:hypothetical protein